MRGQEAVQWIMDECAMHGDKFGVTRSPLATEVRVNDRLVFSFMDENMDFDPGIIIGAYGAGAMRRPPPQGIANPNDHLWYNELPPPEAPEREYVEADLEAEAAEHARAMARRMEWRDEEYVVYHPANVAVSSGEIVPLYKGDLEDVVEFTQYISTTEAKKLGDGWIQNLNVTTGSTLDFVGNNFTGYEVDLYGNMRPMRVVRCKLNKHYISEGAEFCEKCCWNCQAMDEAPFCPSCRKTMRAKQKEDESVRSFTSEHFPSMVPFLD